MSTFDITPQVEEQYPQNEEVRGTAYAEMAEERPYDGYEGCWPGDGSGMDDLQDFMQMEGGDW